MKKHSRAAAHHKNVSEHARHLIAATAHISDSKVAEAREKLADVVESAKDAFEYLEDKAVETAKQTDEFIREQPYKALGIAMGVGALIGFCLARRK